MKKVLALSVILTASWLFAAEPTESAPTSERMAWWREARFGMFVHWDMSSLAGTEISWSRKGSKPLDNGGKPAGYVEDPVYDNLYKNFNPTNFDAKAWVRLAKAAGMKYLVFTAKHHGGFCMWDTKLTDYSIMHTPFKRDVVKELAEVCHAEGLRFGIYYSQRDWHQPDYGQGDNQKYVAYMNGQVRELLTNYGRIDVIWWDSYGRGDLVNFWRIGETFDLVKQLQPDIVMNNRLAVLARYNRQPAPYRGDFDTPEQRLGGFQDTRLWESCMTLVHCRDGGGWSYRPDGKLRSLEECVWSLVRCASGDGNLLLDVGPDATGIIPADQSTRLVEMGKWLEQNGESIYGTRGGPWLPAKNITSTRKGNTVYLHLLKVENGQVELPALAAEIKSALVLHGGKVGFSQKDGKLVIVIPPSVVQPMDTIVKLELDRPALEIKPVAIEAEPKK